MKGYAGARVILRNVAAASIIDRSVEGATGALTEQYGPFMDRWYVLLDKDPADWPRSINAQKRGYHYWCYPADCELCEGPW